MQRGRRSFSFFIKKDPVEFIDRAMFTFSAKKEVMPYLPMTVALFGSMTLEECKILASYLYLSCGVNMRVPRDFDHPRFHGDVIIVPFSELIEQLELFFGNPKALPAGAVLSMSAFFDYLRDEADLTVLPRPKKKSLNSD